MSNIKPKSQETLIAQYAAYTAETIKDEKKRQEMLRILGDCAKELSNGMCEDDAYHIYLREKGGSRAASVSRREEMLTRYKEFQPYVEQLRVELSEMDDASKHPCLLGAGVHSMAFLISHNGKDYAVRIPKDTPRNTSLKEVIIDNHVAGAVLGNDVPNIETIVAASYSDGVTVAEVVSGKEMNYSMTVSDMEGITSEQIEEFVQTIINLNKAGVEIDQRPTNVLYDSINGFGVVDYNSSKVVSKFLPDQNLGTAVGLMATAMMSAGSYGNYRPARTREEYEEDAQIMTCNQRLLKEYRKAVEKLLEGEDLKVALSYIKLH